MKLAIGWGLERNINLNLEIDMANVLVVDDEAHIRDLLRFVLEEDGHQMEGAANGDLALEMNRMVPADVIVTDIFLPGINGLDLIKQLREEFPRVRIIAISGGLNVNQEEDLFQASRLGADRVFSKPFDLKEVAAAVAMLAGDGSSETASPGDIGLQNCLQFA